MSAVDLKNLCVLSYGQEITQWGYRTKHSRREIEGHGYFAGLNTPGERGHAQPGDWLFVTHETADGKVAYGSIYVFDNEGRARSMIYSSVRLDGAR